MAVGSEGTRLTVLRGNSGSGKSTVAKALHRTDHPGKEHAARNHRQHPGRVAAAGREGENGDRDESEPTRSCASSIAPREASTGTAGSDSVPELWAKRYWRRRQHPAGDVNLHIRVAGSPNERLALLFRDWLRTHPPAIAAYARFKAVLADAVKGDLEVYTDVKDPVVDLVVAAADRWANETGWQPHS